MSIINQKLFTLFLQGNTSKDEDEKINEWMMHNIDSRSLDDEILTYFDNVPLIKDEERKERVLNNIHRKINHEKSRHRFKWLTWSTISVSIVSVAAILFLTVILFNQEKEMEAIPSWTLVESVYGEKKSVQLPDGSIIWLHNDSHIIYPDQFTGGKRQVFVSGEVFSDIAKDKKHPFIMSTDKVNVIVRGTKFNFKAYPENKNTELTLVEGAVDLDYKTVSGRAVMAVEPGEKVTVDFDADRISKTRYDLLSYKNWKDCRSMYFNDLPLHDIISRISEEFGITIVVKDKELLETRHFASFVNDESALEMLTAICSSYNVSVKQVNNQIIIE